MRNIEGSQTRGVVACFTRFDRCHVDEHRARRHGGGNTLTEKNVFNSGAALQPADNNVCAFDGITGQLVNSCTQFGQPVCVAWVYVPRANAVPCCAKSFGHGQPHVAKSQYGKVHTCFQADFCSGAANMFSISRRTL